MNWVDLLGDVRWSVADLENRARNELWRDFPDWVELQQEVSEFSAGVGLLPNRDRLDAYTGARAALREQVAAETARAQLVAQRIEVEEAGYALSRLPPAPEEGPDPHAEERIGLQAIVDAASPEVASLVVQRNKYPAPEDVS